MKFKLTQKILVFGFRIKNPLIMSILSPYRHVMTNFPFITLISSKLILSDSNQGIAPDTIVTNDYDLKLKKIT